MEEISERVKEYIRLYKEEDYPLREVAKHFKVSVSTIYNAMITAGFSEFRAKSSRCSNKRMSMEQQAIRCLQLAKRLILKKVRHRLK
ncbi:MAG: hypothetical protein LH649_13245 [Pseudanabaena sp. CAN_BIN31]|nr:hypothetical protein [Pseudanabaena sp. CAN_BIN31]